MSLAGCNRRWPTTTRSPAWSIGAGAEVGLEDRRAGLLDLQEQRVLAVARHQRHEAAGADAADTDHLDGHVFELVAVEQHLAVGGERAR